MKNKKVVVIIGSKSDEPFIEDVKEILNNFEITYEIKILSAHRNLRGLIKYVDSLERSGVEVIIAAAGYAAALPGVIAAITSLPVIGIPLNTSSLGGVDSLYSIVQMPKGVPVACVGINSAKNAAIFAAEILGLKDSKIKEKIKSYRAKLEDKL